MIVVVPSNVEGSKNYDMLRIHEPVGMGAVSDEWVSNEEVQNTVFEDKWPEIGPDENDDFDDGFDADADGWNVHDERISDWYSIVHNMNTPRTIMAMPSDAPSIASWTVFNDDNEDDDQSRGAHKSPSLWTSPRKYNKASPTAKLRENLPKLLCQRPLPPTEDQVALLSDAPIRLGASRRLHLMDSLIENRTVDEEDEGEEEDFIASSGMHKTELFPKGCRLTMSFEEISSHCGDRSNRRHFELHSEEESNSSRSTVNLKDSSLAGCSIDPQLMQAFDAMGTKGTTTSDSPDYRVKKTTLPPAQLDIAEMKGRVEERRRWLQEEAFKSDSSSTSGSSVSRPSPGVSMVVRKLGGRRKTGVMKKREEWEHKFAKKGNSDNSGGRKTKWETRNGGAYRKIVVLEMGE